MVARVDLRECRVERSEVCSERAAHVAADLVGEDLLRACFDAGERLCGDVVRRRLRCVEASRHVGVDVSDVQRDDPCVLVWSSSRGALVRDHAAAFDAQ